MKKTLFQIYNRLRGEYGPQGWWPVTRGKEKEPAYCGGPKTDAERFEVMVGAILTQNTAWKNVVKALRNLREAGFTEPSSLRKARNDRLARLVRSSGYYNQKALKLKKLCRFLNLGYGDSLRKMGREETPLLREKLLDVDGIGQETADSILLYAFDRPVFVVDAYTRRVLKRHGLIPGKAKYGEIQSLFEAHLPPDPVLYNEYHALLVRLAKEACRKKPLCDTCPLHPLLGSPKNP